MVADIFKDFEPPSTIITSYAPESIEFGSNKPISVTFVTYSFHFCWFQNSNGKLIVLDIWPLKNGFLIDYTVFSWFIDFLMERLQYISNKFKLITF